MSEANISAGTRARVGIADPDGVRLYLQLTMSAAEWRGLMRQLPSDGSNAGRLSLMIANMLGECISRTERTLETTGYAIAEAE